MGNTTDGCETNNEQILGCDKQAFSGRQCYPVWDLWSKEWVSGIPSKPGC